MHVATQSLDHLGGSVLDAKQNEDNTQILNFKIFKLTTHTGCVAARQAENDLDYAWDRGHMRTKITKTS